MALASPATALWVLARRTASRASNSASPLLLGALDQHAQASAVDPAVYILIGVERGFHAGTQSMHAAKVKGQRELQDFQVSWTIRFSNQRRMGIANMNTERSFQSAIILIAVAPAGCSFCVAPKFSLMPLFWFVCPLQIKNVCQCVEATACNSLWF